MYHNRTQETGPRLELYQDQAKTQEQQIKTMFQIHRELTPSECYIIAPAGILLTSIRRAISDLKRAGYLEKTQQKRTGLYNRPETVYTLATYEKS